MKRAPISAIEVEAMPDGTLKIDIGSRKKDKTAISEAVAALGQEAVDNLFGLFDRLRDLEESERKPGTITEETVRLVVAVEVTKKSAK